MQSTRTPTAFSRGWSSHARPEDLQAVRDAVAQDDLAQAGRIAYGLDTYVRDEIPKRLFNAIMKANGTNS